MRMVSKHTLIDYAATIRFLLVEDGIIFGRSSIKTMLTELGAI